MLTRWHSGFNEVDEMFSAMNQLRSYMDRVFDDALGWRAEGRMMPLYAGNWPRANLVDLGSTLVVAAEVPGLSENDVEITLNQDVLTISGERKAEPLEGYTVHRQERPTVQFSRSFALPCRVDGERTSATVKDGLLTVRLEKAADAQPRQIAVKSAS